MWSGVKIVGGIIGGIVGGALIVAGTIGSAPIWVAGLGVVVAVVGITVAVIEIGSVIGTAGKIVAPIRKPVQRRNRAIDRALDCTGLGGG